MWYETVVVLPPEGVKVLASMGPSKQAQELIRKGYLWWLPDMSMYVYYTPTHWKYN